MGDFLDQVRSVVGAKRSDSESDANPEMANGDGGSETEARLFECPACERVFIDTEKQTCSECDAEVEQVWGA